MPGRAHAHFDQRRLRAAPQFRHAGRHRGRTFVVDIRQCGEEIHERLAVGSGVMNLCCNRVAALRQPVDIVEPLDDVHIPERTVHIQWPGVIARHVDAELAPVRGLGQAPVANVVFEVEVFVVHPVREVEFQRHPHEAPLEQRTHVQAALDMIEDVPEAHDPVIGYRRLVEYHDRRQVRATALRFHVQKLGVLGG